MPHLSQIHIAEASCIFSHQPLAPPVIPPSPANQGPSRDEGSPTRQRRMQREMCYAAIVVPRLVACHSDPLVSVYISAPIYIKLPLLFAGRYGNLPVRLPQLTVRHQPTNALLSLSPSSALVGPHVTWHRGWGQGYSSGLALKRDCCCCCFE